MRRYGAPASRSEDTSYRNSAARGASLQLYFGSSPDFVEDATRNAIAGKLEAAFFEHFRFRPSIHEVQSWQNSLLQMSNVLRTGSFLDHGIILEYQLPLSSKRLDCMVTGHDGVGRPNAVVVELKQWGNVEPSDADDCVVTYLAGKKRDLLHPSRQVGQYEEYLRGMHTAFADGRIGLRSCAYLHNLRFDARSEIFSPKFAGLLSQYPSFAGDEQNRLVDYLDAYLAGGAGERIRDTVVAARFRASRKLLALAARVIARQEEFVLIDSQQVAFNKVLADVRGSVAGGGRKSIHLVRGGPGSGKSIIALHLLGRLAGEGRRVMHLTGSKAFTENLRKLVGPRVAPLMSYFNFNRRGDLAANHFDAVVLDEAHRMHGTSVDRFTPKAARSGKSQIREIVDASRVSVFFIDDLQVVRPGEVGSTDLVRATAREIGAELHEYELEAQFRCGGSDGFVNWVDNTLGIRPTANVLWKSDPEFDFRIVDSIAELEAIVASAARRPGTTARLAAGFCWPWSDPLPDGTLVADVVVGDWRKPWNAKPDAGRLAKGIPKASYWASEPEGIYQVGCIYTAQGFEFDVIGVIFGRDLRFDWERNTWVGDRAYSEDAVVKRAGPKFLDLVKNTYRVLLTRGMKACYVHFLDEGTQRYFRSRMDVPGVWARD